LLIVKHNSAANGFNLWTLNGEAFSVETMSAAIGSNSVTQAMISTRSTCIATVSSS
jgi:hypothetical protein